MFAAVAIVMVLVGIGIQYHTHSSDASDVTGREKRLERAIAKEGEKWQIAKELELDGYIVSGAYSTEQRAAITVFEQDANGDYQFLTAKDGNVDQVLMDQIIIREKVYDVIWFAGAQTEYANVTYTLENQVQHTIQYDTANMDLWYHEAPDQAYTIQVSYYDAQGNAYQ